MQNKLEEGKNEYLEVVSSSVEIPVNEQVLEYLTDPELGFPLACYLARHPEECQCLASLDSIGLTAAVESILSNPNLAGYPS